MLAEAVTDLHFFVPNRLEMFDQVILRRFDPSASHHEVATLEILDLQIYCSTDAPRMVPQAG